MVDLEDLGKVREDEWFHRNEQKLIEAAKAKREAELKEQKDAQKKEKEFDPISDDEEDPSTSEASAETIQHPSARALGKRRATSDQLIKLKDNNKVPLPNNSYLEEGRTTQRRSSGRVPKRLRQDEDFVYL